MIFLYILFKRAEHLIKPYRIKLFKSNKNIRNLILAEVTLDDFFAENFHIIGDSPAIHNLLFKVKTNRHVHFPRFQYSWGQGYFQANLGMLFSSHHAASESYRKKTQRSL